METSVFNSLVLVAFGLMVVVSGGIGYLTIVEWRDRRRREQERRGDRPVRSSNEKPANASKSNAKNSGKVKSGKVKK